MKFKDGDRVKIKVACVGTEVGEIYTLERKNGDLFAGGCCDQDYWELLGSRKEASMKNWKWGVKYEEDEDPVEFFKTKKEAEKYVEELLDRSGVDKNEIYLFQISEVFKVKRPTRFELVKE